MNNWCYIKKLLATVWLITSFFLGSYQVFSSVTDCSEKEPQKSSISSESASQQQLHGEVEVSFKIGTDGKANILDIKSENPDLVNYVKTKLNKIKLEKDDFNIDEVITYRFVFKKEA